jgi:hypothetical protein
MELDRSVSTGGYIEDLDVCFVYIGFWRIWKDGSAERNPHISLFRFF